MVIASVKSTFVDEIENFVFGEIKSTIAKRFHPCPARISSAPQIYPTQRVDLIAFTHGKCLLPFNCRRRFAGDVIDDSADTLHFVDYA